mmetsp:Transcript_36226/g.94945  ORF Transcript_36226/g.94945 Transcript_36226/m.94945 type:complete len:211 (+) Transcript_36226:5702-6334(+)
MPPHVAQGVAPIPPPGGTDRGVPLASGCQCRRGLGRHSQDLRIVRDHRRAARVVTDRIQILVHHSCCLLSLDQAGNRRAAIGGLPGEIHKTARQRNLASRVCCGVPDSHERLRRWIIVDGALRVLKTAGGCAHRSHHRSTTIPCGLRGTAHALVIVHAFETEEVVRRRHIVRARVDARLLRSRYPGLQRPVAAIPKQSPLGAVRQVGVHC